MRNEQPVVSGIIGFGKPGNAGGRAYSCFSLSEFRGHIWRCRLIYMSEGMEQVMAMRMQGMQLLHIPESGSEFN